MVVLRRHGAASRGRKETMNPHYKAGRNFMLLTILIFTLKKTDKFQERTIQATTRITDFLVVDKLSVILVKWPKIR